jgi:predicted ATPase/DNA-binding SARP family transcriptional activator
MLLPNAVELRLFGPFAATVHGEPLPRLRSRKGQWLLALLALRQGRDVARQWLAGILWPECDESHAYYNLRQCLSNLRAALGVESCRLQSSTPLTLRLDSQHVFVDVAEFDRLITSNLPDSLEKAVALYRGPLMEGCDEEMFAADRAERERNCFSALSALAQRAMQDGDTDTAIHLFRQTTTLDPYHETAYRGLMTALSSAGNHAAALHAYRDLRLLLHREMNVRPSEETEALAEQVHERLRRSPSQPARIGRATITHTGHLPLPLTNLIGRQREMEELKRGVESHRLVTVTGPGGIGKTRLAIAAGGLAAGAFELRARFIDLQAISDPLRVAPLLAQTLAIRQEIHRPVSDTLAEALGSQSVLIIIDNAEHLLAPCAALAERLLTSCPHVHLLFTSRQSIGLTGERVYRVPPLSLPSSAPIQTENDLQALLSFEGIALLVERVCEWNAGFRLTHRNVSAIIEICRQLDGIPLAIELAAARLRTLSAEEVRLGLQNRFALLTTGSRTALPRHRTLRTLIDWSYDLLTPQEQELLQNLSVFCGGWTVDAAERVCTDSVVDPLSSLVDKSLVSVDTMAGHARYRMLETIRQYAAEKLRHRGNDETLRKRHCDYFAALAESIDRQENHPEQAEPLSSLEAEYENLNAAILWCRERPDEVTTAFKLVMLLYPFWHLRGRMREGREHLIHATVAAARYGAQNTEAKLLLQEGALARLLGDIQGARASLEKARQLAQSIGDTLMDALSLVLLGSLALAEGSNAEGVDLLTEAYRISSQDDFPAVQSEALVWLGDAARMRSDFVAARRMYEEGLAAARKTNIVWYEANALGMMAELALAEGEIAEAKSLAADAMTGYLAAGDRTYCVLLLDTLAGIALAEGNAERACTLVAVVDRLSEEIKMQMPGHEQRTHDARIVAARALLPPDRFVSLYQGSDTLTWEQIIEFARHTDGAA